MAILFDTGILLRLFDSSDSHHGEIREALRKLVRRSERLVTTFQNVAEFWNVSTRPSTARGGYGIPADRVKRRLRTIERVFDVLIKDELAHRAWKERVETYKLVGVSVHDARLAAVMSVNHIREIMTLNERDFARFADITVVTPPQVE